MSFGVGPLFLTKTTTLLNKQLGTEHQHVFFQWKRGNEPERRLYNNNIFFNPLLLPSSFSPSLSRFLFLPFIFFHSKDRWSMRRMSKEENGGCKLSKKWRRREKIPGRQKKSGLSTQLETGFVSKLRDSPSSRMRYKKLDRMNPVSWPWHWDLRKMDKKRLHLSLQKRSN